LSHWSLVIESLVNKSLGIEIFDIRTFNHQLLLSFFHLSLQNKSIALDKQKVIFEDLGIIDYKTAWDYQERLLQANVKVKSVVGSGQLAISAATINHQPSTINPVRMDIYPGGHQPSTTNHFLLCEHPAVYTLGKSGKIEHVLMSEDELKKNNIQFFNTNRGGDITFHGLQQMVGYPILDLENFYTDIGKYLRHLEEVIILTIAQYGIKGQRSSGETGVWIEPGVPGKERKIAAIGVRCSRWVTMHGFALNVNTDLSYFNNIIPCGIQNKQVTSIEKELGKKINYEEAKKKLKKNFEKVFEVVLE
jgi:lipoyl(octanoyl) transferase